MIEVKDLTKRYGDHLAVDHLNFHVEKGQIYGFLGPNGAGKSTTMNILTGYLAATEGTVTVNGHDVLIEPEEAKKSIGYLPEVPPLYMEMTVLEYLRFAAELKKVPREERTKQVEEVMELTMILDMAGRLIRNLSKGYKQRVGLAQAILGYPEVIILDEPTVGLDPKQIIEIRDLIRRLGEKHTIILSSHILSEVSAICDHIMIISHGKLVASDSPEGLQKLIKGTSELSLTIKGSREEILETLQDIAYIEKTESAECREAGCTALTLTVSEQKDVREEVFFRLAEARLPIMGMEYANKSLEDIFLELTQDSDSQDREGENKVSGKKKKNPLGKKSIAGEKETAAEETGKGDMNNDSDL